ncbi:hypothetical protein PMIT1313_00101 [Prochlorococcus marinus str. MIT 1313]|uniref:hypothetical protein n=1 Tax=Prochlorococcus TaxID=1218 RepID=UPI0007BC6C74|nr:hypothetical protein [Prochlorococcus marinus]KZR72361.1 hypothetical protein PMIT1313_00101 [Prochlorococcus marinus str. MIT 1313]KZR74046.1 hypothetical protein PMIT1318_00405 [Prochlorococcus marinus str. MIT 1318]
MTIARVSCDAVTVHCGLGMAAPDSGLFLSSFKEFAYRPALLLLSGRMFCLAAKRVAKSLWSGRLSAWRDV